MCPRVASESLVDVFRSPCKRRSHQEHCKRQLDLLWTGYTKRGLTSIPCNQKGMLAIPSSSDIRSRYKLHSPYYYRQDENDGISRVPSVCASRSGSHRRVVSGHVNQLAFLCSLPQGLNLQGQSSFIKQATSVDAITRVSNVLSKLSATLTPSPGSPHSHWRPGKTRRRDKV